MNGNFAAQLTDGSQFSQVETDKVIKMTLHKDTKIPGGCTGFSRNVNAVKRWEINAAYRAVLRTCFHKHLDYQPQKYKHPDLNPSRIKKDENDVQRILAINKTKTCKVNSKITPVQAGKELFAKISLVAQIRSLDMRSVF